MANTNALIAAGPTVKASTFHSVYTITKEDLVALGDFLTGDIILFALPAGAIITRTHVKASTAVTGVTTAVGYVKTTNHDYGNTSFDLKAAVSATNRDLYSTEQKETETNVLFHVIVTTDHLDDTTAGQIEVAVDYVVR